MAYSESYCNSYFQQTANYSPIYIWGCNWHKLSSMEEATTLFNLYGSNSGKYNQAYYNSKVQQALSGSGYASDCSGYFYQINDGVDRTAQGYYDHCTSKGDISTIDLSHSCLLFRGSGTKINHVGFYNSLDNCSYEMANSDDNFRRQPFNAKNWTYWGRPEFIDYSSVPVVQTKQYLYKGIDMSTYQKNINYQALKDAGVEFAILKIINKQGNMDSMYAVHSAALDAVGIKIQAVYNYSYATTTDKAIADANAVLKCLGTRKCAVCLDVEDNVQKTLGSGLIDIINAYQTVIESSGRAFLLYSGQSFYKTYIAPYSANLRCKQLWIARYYNGYNAMNFSEDPNEAYKPMENIVAWQYTSSGYVPNVDGRLDLNVMYKEIASPSATPEPIIVPEPVVPSPTPKLNGYIKNTVSTNGKRLNVRDYPSLDGDIVGKLNNGDNVIIYGTDKEGKWARLSVPYNQWSSLEYISSTAYGRVTAEKSLYVRSSDSKTGDIWGVYKANEVVKILHQSTNTGWYLTVGTDKDGKQIGGWCSNKYITTK